MRETAAYPFGERDIICWGNTVVKHLKQICSQRVVCIKLIFSFIYYSMEYQQLTCKSFIKHICIYIFLYITYKLDICSQLFWYPHIYLYMQQNNYEQMLNFSSGYMDILFQLRCIFEVVYNIKLGKTHREQIFIQIICTKRYKNVLSMFLGYEILGYEGYWAQVWCQLQSSH